ncbi:uncharacterized protein LOC134706769 [Mytilus trossulus]|uniref:uncharacterized protein LOC134706769 n=1 Tax=Mytilus trossulus TaxID=6551 RepID=UPI0030070C10
MQTYLFSSLCVVVCVSLLTVHAIPSFEDFLSNDQPWSSLPQCSSDNKPCDYALKTISQRRSPNGDVEPEETVFETITEICTCRDGITCPRGWDNAPGRTITRNLLSSGKRVEYKSNYCTEPTPDTICNVEAGEVAVVLTGVMYPDVIQSVNCACPNNNYNLHLKRAYYVSTFQITHEFVCSMRTCNMNTSNRRVCKKIKKDETTEYRCTCPEEYECRMEPSARKGYCERRVEM